LAPVRALSLLSILLLAPMSDSPTNLGKDEQDLLQVCLHLSGKVYAFLHV
jgi:hypothetical protein